MVCGGLDSFNIYVINSTPLRKYATQFSPTADVDLIGSFEDVGVKNLDWELSIFFIRRD